jgi:hypothetical protein
VLKRSSFECGFYVIRALVCGLLTKMEYLDLCLYLIG